MAFVGDPKIGKSSLINYSLEEECVPSVESTSLVDLVFKKIKLRDDAIINVSFVFIFSMECGTFQEPKTH